MTVQFIEVRQRRTKLRLTDGLNINVCIKTGWQCPCTSPWCQNLLCLCGGGGGGQGHCPSGVWVCLGLFFFFLPFTIHSTERNGSLRCPVSHADGDSTEWFKLPSSQLPFLPHLPEGLSPSLPCRRQIGVKEKQVQLADKALTRLSEQRQAIVVTFRREGPAVGNTSLVNKLTVK